MSTPANDMVTLGKFASVYGVKGWIKVVSYTDPPANILDFTTWYVWHDKQWQAVTVEAGKPHGKFIVVKLKDHDIREDMMRYTNNPIAVPREVLPELTEDEYYWQDLIGLTVIDQNGKSQGKIAELQNTGANDIIIIEGEQRHLLPYIKDVVISIDLEQQIMRVDWEFD